LWYVTNSLVTLATSVMPLPTSNLDTTPGMDASPPAGGQVVSAPQGRVVTAELLQLMTRISPSLAT
jgi:hypothetical protein